MSPSLEARGLTRRFGSHTAVDHLNLRAEGSKCIGFLGPNGAGKTTTLKMFTNLIFPTEGEAFLNGVPVARDRKRALASCGALIETPEIYPSLTPREALELTGALWGMSRPDVRSRTEEVLEKVGMLSSADLKVGRFSKGMKQRVNIAVTLLSDPEVILLDEPSSGLDPRGMTEVRSIIRGLKGEGRLIFFSSHLLAEVADVCDEVALLNKGKLVLYDTLHNVTANLASGVANFEIVFQRPVSASDVTDHIAHLPGVESVSRLNECRFSIGLTGGPDVQNAVLKALAERPGGLLSFTQSRSALEDVYLREIPEGES